jgi:transposase-like protein
VKLSDDLGISRDLLYRWRSDFKRKGQLAFPGHGKEALTLEERRIRQLEKRLHEAELERDILKKQWPSSARHRNEIFFYRSTPLNISGEEDVPGTQSISERLLQVEK